MNQILCATIVTLLGISHLVRHGIGGIWHRTEWRLIYLHYRPRLLRFLVVVLTLFCMSMGSVSIHVNEYL